jgi:hypothetical protein
VQHGKLHRQHLWAADEHENGSGGEQWLVTHMQHRKQHRKHLQVMGKNNKLVC